MDDPLAEIRTAYLARLGVEPEPPSADALVRLHRAHVERVPWETLWIHLGASWPIEPAESMGRIAATGRGGYCFHLNGGFSELLHGLGYRVTRHVGGVHGPDGEDAAEMTNHLVLTVHDLPTADHPDGDWYVDVGLGDALHEPLPRRPGTYDQAPFRLQVDDRSEVGDWHLTHDPAGAFPGMAWRAAATGMDAFAERHEWLSTSPESRFVKVLTVQRRDATGVDVLRGLWLRRVGEGASDATLATRGELTDALGDVFGFDLRSVDDGALDALWTRVHTAHEHWEAAGRP